MKKFLFLSLIAFFAVATNVSAQKYFVYDGDDFNVMLKCSSDNSKVLEVSFTDAAKSKWIKFSIVDFQDFEDSDEGGFRYTVEDTVGKQFYIDYFRDEDYTTVTNITTYDSWTLYRRADE